MALQAFHVGTQVRSTFHDDHNIGDVALVDDDHVAAAEPNDVLRKLSYIGDVRRYQMFPVLPLVQRNHPKSQLRIMTASGKEDLRHPLEKWKKSESSTGRPISAVRATDLGV